MRKLFIFVVAVAFVAACVMPAMAQEKEVNLYGSVRMETFARYFSKETAGRGGELDRDVTQFEIGNSSRFGANFKAGNTSANVELRPFGAPETGGSGTSNFRQWWGQVDFTGWQLRVGQQSVLDGLFPPGCCIDEGSVQSNFGGWSGQVRTPGLAAFIPIGQGTLKFGLFHTGTLAADATGSIGSDPRLPAGTTGSDVDVHIPQIQVSYDIKFGPAAVKFVGGYNTYDEVYWVGGAGPPVGTGATSDITESIDSWVLGGQVEANFGPFTVMWQIHYSENPSAYKGRAGLLNPLYDAVTNTIQDVTEWGSFARIIYKMSDMVSWELGGGYANQEQDYSPADLDDDGLFVYLNAQIFLSKTFRFTPEVGYFDLRTRSQDPGLPAASIEDGSQWYWGAYWRIDF
jgi:hypothetical protein